MIYLPIEDFSSYSCYTFINSDTIRAYKTIPTNNSNVEFNDYFINSHYLSQNGIEFFTQDSILPVCLDQGRLTNVYSYRNDFSDIIIIVLCFCLFGGFIIHKLTKQLFKRWR